MQRRMPQLKELAVQSSEEKWGLGRTKRNHIKDEMVNQSDVSVSKDLSRKKAQGQSRKEARLNLTRDAVMLDDATVENRVNYNNVKTQ